MKVRRSEQVPRGRTPMPALLLASLLVSLTLTLPALSAAQSGAASEAKPAGAPGAASYLPPAPPPAGVPGAPLRAAPPASPSMAPGTAAGTVSSAAAPGRADADAQPAATEAPVAANPPRLALVLPLDSPVYGRAAEAVRAGFAAAAAPTDVRYAVVAHGDGDVRAAIDRAIAAGARVVVGPLVRDDLKAIAAAGGDLPPTIALNQLDEGGTLPRRVYTLALAIESEGAQLARLASADGARSVAIVGGDAPLQKRFAAAFTGEWILQGGGPPVVLRVDRAPEMLALLRRELQKVAPDAVLLALDGEDAALVKPYLGQVSAFTSSQVNDRQAPESLRDLDQVRFVEIPWLADPTGPASASVRRADYGSATLDRLYALGIDGFRVAQAFGDGPPETLELDGATGHLVLDRSRHFLREGVVLQFREGAVVAAGRR